MRTSLMIGSRFSMAFLGLGCAFVLSACGSAGAEMAEGNDDEAENIETTQEALTNGWTAWTGGLVGPVSCGGGNVMSQFQCAGSNCAYMRGFCEPTGLIANDHYWLPFSFSEEDSLPTWCNGSDVITGISCTGNLCDNVRIECTSLAGIQFGGCFWTSPFSEEWGGLSGWPTGSGSISRGARCSGNNCDDMQVYACPRL